MKIIASAVTFTLFASLASCASDLETATTTDELVSSLGPDATVTEKWFPGKMSITNLWPADPAITTTHILYRKAPQYCVSPDDLCDAQHGTLTNAYVAVVVWNHTTVGHAYWIPEGPTGTDFKNLVNQTFATRTNGAPDHSGGSTGGAGAGDVGIPHPPRPNVFPLTTAFIAAAKTAATTADLADRQFIAASMQ